MFSYIKSYLLHDPDVSYGIPDKIFALVSPKLFTTGCMNFISI